jgi:hypothetical protein
MAEVAGLPGPVGRDVARRVAVEARLAAHGLWRVLAAVRKVGESDFLRGRKRATGQGDWRADFDWVFEVRRYSGSGHFQRLLEGSYTADAVPAGPEPEPPAIRETEQRAGPSIWPDGVEERLRGAVSARAWEAWFAPLRPVPGEVGLAAAAPSAFHADWLRQNFGPALAAAGIFEVVVQRVEA